MTDASENEREQLRDATRGFLARHRPPAAVREALERPRTVDRAAWRDAAAMGWVGAAVPDDAGGLGGTVTDLATIAEELGRGTFDGPFLGCVLAATLLTGAEGDEAAALLADLCSGARIAAAAIDAGDADAAAAAARVTLDADGRLHGELLAVLDADVADALLVPFVRDGAFVTALVPADAGVAVRPARGFDLTRRVSAVSLAGASSGPVVAVAPGALARTLALGGALAAADGLGAATRLLEMTVAYAQDRVAFGRPIASYQAVKHKCADMLCWTEGARVAVDAAAAALDGDGDPAYAVSVAKGYAGDACSRVAGEALQIHGGIAFTWEHDLHLLMRRIKADEVLFGDLAFHEDRLAAAVSA
ncbi:MAG TPA: acyl-CoA dehydrogenase family protein [Baekduia sp.]|jgi:alkylation response protein AidB-like acyl-CoA dehydrogenase|nr:acyl-CoA dehydrogenase family protein [Baekduia sp.]